MRIVIFKEIILDYEYEFSIKIFSKYESFAAIARKSEILRKL